MKSKRSQSGKSKSKTITVVKPSALSVSKRPVAPTALLHDVRSLILTTRQTVATAVNATMTQLYWRIGQRIQKISSTISEQTTERRLL